MPIKSVTSHQVEKTYVEEVISPLIFRFCNCILRSTEEESILMGVAHKGERGGREGGLTGS